MAAVERALFVAMPGADVREALLAGARTHDLERQLGRRMFDPLNWHQTLSDRYFNPSGERIEQLKAAGDRINGVAFTLRFDHIGGNADHWVFGTQGGSRGLNALLSDAQVGLRTQGLANGFKTGPHITLSYQSPHPLQQLHIAPVEWQVDEVLLVVGGGSEPYRYRVVDRWPLQPVDQAPGAQLGLGLL